jgi:hypothetical protein
MTTSTRTPSERDDPAARPYRARGALARAWADRSPEVVLEGPAGTGKTRLGLELLHRRANKYPGSRHLLCRKTRESLTESALVTFEQKVLSTADHAALVAPGADRAHRQRYAYPNGSEVVVAGMIASHRDQRARIMSTDYDTVFVPEATELTEHEWEQLGSRCRNGRLPYQQLMGDCNPDAPTHWLHQRCDRGQARAYFARHADNPSVTPEYLARLQALTGVRRDRLFLGLRRAAEGAVYEFDRSRHLIDPFDVPADWACFRAIDFGMKNPFVCLWCALDSDGRLYVYREWHMTGRTVRQHAETIKAHSVGKMMAVTVSDHDAEDRLTLHENGVWTLPAEKDRLRGIQAVQDRLAVQPDGRPRLLVMRGALVEADPELIEAKRPLCLEQEFDGYLWKRGADGKPLTKEAPIDKDDDALDALRYAVMWADQRQRVAGAVPSAGGPTPISRAPPGVFRPRGGFGGNDGGWD